MKKIHLQVEQPPFFLLGLRCPWESFRLAFHLNAKLGIRLSRAARDLELYHKKLDTKVCYPRYTYLDAVKVQAWSLLTNKLRLRCASVDAFFDTAECHVYLVPECKEIDYFLKVEQIEDCDPAAIAVQLRQLVGVRMVVLIDVDTLRSKDNLISEC